MSNVRYHVAIYPPMQVHNAPLFGPNNAKRPADDALMQEGVVALRLFESENDMQRRLFYSWWWEVNHHRFNVSKPDEPNAALIICRAILVNEEDEFGLLFDLRSFRDLESIRTQAQDAITHWRAAGRPRVFNSDSLT